MKREYVNQCEYKDCERKTEYFVYCPETDKLAFSCKLHADIFFDDKPINIDNREDR